MDDKKLFYCSFCGRGYSFPRERIGTPFTCPLCLGTMQREPHPEKDFMAIAVPITEGESFVRDGFTVKDGLLVSYGGSDPSPTIPPGVTVIGERAFAENRTLREIAIPEGVRYIGHYAFAKCEAMRRMTLPKGLIAIGNGAFEECRRLERVKIPSTLRAAGYAVFRACANLTEADFPMDMVFMGGTPHSYCRRLVRSQVPHCVQSVSYWLDDNDALESLTLGRGVRSIDYPLVSPRLSEVFFTDPEGWAYTPCNITRDEPLEMIDPAILSHPKKAAQFLRKLKDMRRTIRRAVQEGPREYFHTEIDE